MYSHEDYRRAILLARKLWRENFNRDILHDSRMIDRFGYPVDIDGVVEGLFRHLTLGQSEDQINYWLETTKEFKDLHPFAIPIPLTPITLGNWFGNFLYNEEFYFGPSCVAWNTTQRQRYFNWTKQMGYKHIWINAQQDNWDSRYTYGGYDIFHSGLSHLTSVLIEARQEGLIPCLGLHDQRQTIELMREPEGLDRLIREDNIIIEATHEHVALYMGLTWELNEVPGWRIGSRRNPDIIKYFSQINNHGRDVGIHYAPSPDGDVYGGFQLWDKLPSYAVRLQQFPKDASIEELVNRTEQAVIVHENSNGKLCIFEHSRMHMPGRPGGGQTLADAQYRANVCAEVIKDRLPPFRWGSMNG